MTAGLWALKRLTPKLYKDLARARRDAGRGFADAARAARRAAAGQRLRLARHAVLHERPVRGLRVGARADTEAYAAFFRAC
jgi:hypothetical protein